MRNIAIILAICSIPNLVAAEDFGLTDTFKKCMDESGGTSFNMSECVSAEAEFQDARLNSAYKKVLSGLPGDQKTALRNTQRSWIKYRDEKCELAGRRYDGGTIQPVIVTDCVMQMTAERSKELEGMIEEDHVSATEPQSNQLGHQISDQQIQNMAGDMYRAALFGGVDGMIRTENGCWASISGNTASNVDIESCAIYGISGTIIDATFARAQMRGLLPAYDPDALRERIFENAKKHGFSKEKTQEIIEKVGKQNIDKILAGLMNAGMR